MRRSRVSSANCRAFAVLYRSALKAEQAHVQSLGHRRARVRQRLCVSASRSQQALLRRYSHVNSRARVQKPQSWYFKALFRKLITAIYLLTYSSYADAPN